MVRTCYPHRDHRGTIATRRSAFAGDQSVLCFVCFAFSLLMGVENHLRSLLDRPSCRGIVSFPASREYRATDADVLIDHSHHHYRASLLPLLLLLCSPVMGRVSYVQVNSINRRCVNWFVNDLVNQFASQLCRRLTNEFSNELHLVVHDKLHTKRGTGGFEYRMFHHAEKQLKPHPPGRLNFSHNFNGSTTGKRVCSTQHLQSSM